VKQSFFVRPGFGSMQREAEIASRKDTAAGNGFYANAASELLLEIWKT